MATESIRAMDQAAKRFSEGRTLAGSTIAKSTPARSITDLGFLSCRGLSSRMVPGLTFWPLREGVATWLDTREPSARQWPSPNWQTCLIDDPCRRPGTIQKTRSRTRERVYSLCCWLSRCDNRSDISDSLGFSSLLCCCRSFPSCLFRAKIVWFSTGVMFVLWRGISFTLKALCVTCGLCPNGEVGLREESSC
jgi:hypothetical protein